MSKLDERYPPVQDFIEGVWDRLKAHPVSFVRWVPFAKVRANDYNPNRVASVELQLLYVSVREDGYTQPVVTVYDEDADLFFIVDGFHRWRILAEHKDVLKSTGGLLPVVVLDKGINDRMASTIRHNRARGKHGVGDMAQIVFDLLDNGWKDTDICENLGMSADELIRLKHVSGFSKLFEDTEYRRAWETRRMAQLRREYAQEHPEEALP